MSTSGVENIVSQAMKNLMAEWNELRPSWQDLKAVEFQKNYLEPLPHHVARAVGVITELNVLLRQVRHDCE
jgi:hypothetical protein